LLDKGVEKETRLIKEEKHLHHATTQMFTKMTPQERASVDRKELVQGFPIAEKLTLEPTIVIRMWTMRNPVHW
jgi:hypothetical protein